MKTKLGIVKRKNVNELSIMPYSKNNANKDLHDINKSHLNINKPQLADRKFLKKEITQKSLQIKTPKINRQKFKSKVQFMSLNKQW